MAPGGSGGPSLSILLVAIAQIWVAHAQPSPHPTHIPTPAPSRIPTPVPTWADDPGATAWVTFCSGTLFLIVPGLGLYHAGLLNDKNALDAIIRKIVALGAVGMQWFTYGWSLAFSSHSIGGGLLGDLSAMFLQNTGFDKGMPMHSVSEGLYCVFQLSFAVIAPCIIGGAVASRMRTWTWLVFVVAWSTVVYDPIVFALWDKYGWLYVDYGVIDFAGGLVLCVSSGTAGLVLAWFVGPRKSFERGEEDVGHNTSLSLIGASLVWMGWLALIGGSAVSADENAIIAIVNTQTACAASFCCWMTLERAILGHVTPAAFTYGVIIGEVSMMSGAPYVSVADAMIIGALTSITCFFGRYVRIHSRIDDTFEAFGFYAIGGAVSTIATGFFACVGECVDEDVKGVLDGDMHQLYRQIFGVFVVGIWSASMTLAVAVVISKFINLRVTQTEEEIGLDISLHRQKMQHYMPLDNEEENPHKAKPPSFASYYQDDWVWMQETWLNLKESAADSWERRDEILVDLWFDCCGCCRVVSKWCKKQYKQATRSRRRRRPRGQMAPATPSSQAGTGGYNSMPEGHSLVFDEDSPAPEEKR